MLLPARGKYRTELSRLKIGLKTLLSIAVNRLFLTICLDDIRHINKTIKKTRIISTNKRNIYILIFVICTKGIKVKILVRSTKNLFISEDCHPSLFYIIFIYTK